MELLQQSQYDVEAIFRRAMQRAYVRVLDNAFLDNGAAVAGVRPAGLLNATAWGTTTAAGAAAGAGGPIDAIRADLDAMVGVILQANEAAVPVLAINNRNRMGMSFVASPLGEFTLADGLAAGTLLNIPIVSSGNVPYDTAMMIDVSSLATAFDMPEYRISQEATVVYADAGPAGTATAPTMAQDAAGAIGPSGQVLPDGGQVVAGDGQPVGAAGAGYVARSAYQQFLELIRAIWPTSFAMTRQGVIVQRTGVNWK